MCKVVEVMIGLLLLVLAWEDWRKRKVSLWILGLLFFICILSRIFWASTSLESTVGGIGLGLLLLGISRWSKEAIGYGDSLLALALGIYMGGKGLLGVLFTASFLACIYSLFFCLRHGWSRKSTLPYIPFIAISYIGGMFL